MVESPSSGARKQVMVSEPRKGLSAQIVINHKPGEMRITLLLSSLKKIRNLHLVNRQKLLGW